MLITSPHNPRVKHVIALREQKQRKQEGVMVVEGYDELTLAYACGVKPQTLFFCPALAGETESARLLAQVRAAGAEVVEVDRRPFEKMAYRENPDGWLAVVNTPQIMLDDLKLGPTPLLIIVEAVEKPGNLGAILRSADAAGAEAVILCDPTVDIGNPNVIRASRGAVFSVPVAEAQSEQTLRWLQSHQILTVAATPEAATLYTQADLRGPVAIVVGTEREGLSQIWRQGANLKAKIPMRGRVNSLNVAASTTLFLFEVVRQRGG